MDALFSLLFGFLVFGGPALVLFGLLLMAVTVVRTRKGTGRDRTGWALVSMFVGVLVWIVGWTIFGQILESIGS